MENDDDWGDGVVTIEPSKRPERHDDGGDSYGGGGGGRGRGGRGGFSDRGGRGGFRGGRGGYNNRDEDGGGERVRRYRNEDDEEDGGGDGGHGGGGRGRGRGGFRGGGRGGFSRRDGDDDNGDENGGGGESRRGRGGGGFGGGRGGRRENGGGDNEYNGGGDGGGRDGENPEEKPKPYVPPEDLEGEEAFSERQKIYGGSGINFDKFNSIQVEITGDQKVPSIKSFEELGLRELVLKNVAKCGYTTPTPIQRNASPQLKNGIDVMACAQTGSGKTAAFLLPIINHLLANQNDLNTDIAPVKPEVLVLAPTRELAIQIGREAKLYSESSILRTTVVYGGAAIFSQKNQMRNGCNIMVATPGRLKMFVNEGTVDLSMVQFFILDEADRMLDMGFMGDVKEIVDRMPPPAERVSGMFSATFQTGVQKAAAAFLKPSYVFVTIGVVGGACTDVKQEFLMIERSEKRSKLVDIIKESNEDDKVLVFCNSKKGADFLAASLSTMGISTTSIHGDRMQSQREMALKEFTNGVRKVLVATAVAARGLDIPKVSIVVNYDLPNEVDEYVHRIGRTGRVGHTGRAVSFFEESQDTEIAGPLVGILRGANQEIPDFLLSASGGGSHGGGGASNGFSSVDHRGGGGGGAPAASQAAAGGDDEEWD